MKVIILIVVVWFILTLPMLRFLILHPITVVPAALVDAFRYFKYKKYNECREFGRIRLNSAKSNQVFGCGKTLSLVKQAKGIYARYNGKKVWSEEKNCFVVQHIRIISNLSLYGVPYIKWIGTKQFTDIDKMGFESQDVIIFLLDEAGTIFNSREFRSNISMEFLTRLLQSRKNKIALYMTSQRFQFTDKILRECCSVVTTCRKFWRIIELCDYDAFEVENVSNVTMLRPIHRFYWFAKDKDYRGYDTQELIEQLKKDNSEGNLLNTEEVLATYGSYDTDINMSTKLKKKFNLRKRKS